MKWNYLLRPVAMVAVWLLALTQLNGQPDAGVLQKSPERQKSANHHHAQEGTREFCIPESSCIEDDYIDAVFLNILSTTSTSCGENGYSDFTGFSTPLNAGEGYWIGVETGLGDQYLSVWIDFNDNEQFEVDEMMVEDAWIEYALDVHWEWFILPDNLQTGIRRMRIRINPDESSADPCSNFNYGETEDYTVEIFGQQAEYCIPFANCSDGDGFDAFMLEDIFNVSSGCSDFGYGDFTDMTATLWQGETYGLGVVSNYGNQWVSMWIDFNDNGEFELDELLIDDFFVEFDSEEYWHEFTLPVEAPAGFHRLRARANYGSPLPDPCEDFEWGETEDYTVEIIENPGYIDVGLVSIDIPNVIPPGNTQIGVTIQNFGNTVESFIISIICELQGTSQWVYDLQPGENRQIDFGNWDMPAGQFEFYSYFSVENDVNPDNDDLLKSVYVQKSVTAFAFTPESIPGAPDGGVVLFNLSTPETFELVSSSTLDDFLTCACWHNELIYAAKAGGGFYTIHPADGTTTLVSPTTEEITGLAFDGENMFATSISLVSKNICQSTLWTIDPQTGNMTPIAEMDLSAGAVMGLACNNSGDLFGFDVTNDNFHAINKSDGTSVIIGNLGFDFIGYQDMSFDPGGSGFYLAGYTTQGALYKISPETGAAMYIGAFQDDAKVTALVLPESVLPVPQNVTAVAANNIVTVNWDEISYWSSEGFRIYCDGVLTGTSPFNSFIDICIEPGEHHYTVSTFNENEESEHSAPALVTVENCSVLLINEGFEEYAPGQQLVAQAQAMEIDYWDTWSHLPGSFEDPYISSEMPFSGNQSLMIETGNDVAMSLGNRTTGKYACDFQLYIEPGYCGYFFIMNDIDQLVYTLEAVLIPDGTGWIMAGHSDWTGFTYIPEEWNQVSFAFDLDNDRLNCFINGVQIIESPLSHAFGGMITPVKLGALDFWGGDYYGTLPKFWIDDINYYELLEAPLPPSNPMAVVNGNEVTLNWESPMEGIIEYKIFRNSNYIGSTFDLSFVESSLEPGNYLYEIVAAYEECEAFTLNPLEILINTEHLLVLSQGWSGISSYLVPANPALENLFAPVLDDLIILHNLNGSYWPGQGINDLGDWETNQGYAIKMAEAGELIFEGIPTAEKVLALAPGWSMMPVLSSCEVEVTALFNNPAVVIVKEIAGINLYWPEAGINTLNVLQPGKAYYILLTDAVVVTFPDCE